MFVLLKGGDRNRLPSSIYLPDLALDATYTFQGAGREDARENSKKKISSHLSSSLFEYYPVFVSPFSVEVPCSSNHFEAGTLCFSLFTPP